MSKKKVIISICAAIAISFIAHIVAPRSPSDDEIRARVVSITNDHMLCSGEQVRAASGKDYILSAAHCAPIAVEGSVTITREDGRKLQRRVIAIDRKSDLMLVEGLPDIRGLEIAKKSAPHQHVRTFTHGNRYPTYETEGLLIGDTLVQFPIAIIESPEDEEKCEANGPNKVMDINVFFGNIKVCVFSAQEMATTAKIVHGSSGGPVFNDRGQVVGVVSAGDSDGSFGFLVRLQDIQAFTANY